ncbi:MAG: AsnC family transcriptional regulator [Firmicutes bacterium]|nr:AsnC family transcriptional regulator [Bacillota bacterium]
MMLDSTDRRLLNLIQAGFPLVPEPYRLLAETLGTGEQEVIDRIGRMLRDGVIRRLGGIFDSRKLGYSGTLCAMRVEPERIDEVAGIVNAFPGVTHNYLRDHDYNMWFTVLAESREALDEILSAIRAGTGLDVITLPAEGIFKIRVNFDLE